MAEQRVYTLAVLVDNEAGVLSQVSRLFSRKGYNIESLAVGPTHRNDESRITIEVISDDDQIILLANQLRKLLTVHSVNILDNEKSLRRELVMIKVMAPDSEIRNEIIQIANIFRGQIVDVSVGALTIALIGDENKIKGLEKILSEFEIIELVRTGYVALERGLDTIYNDTKEKGEFNYGKNVL
ncbi:MAG: acetolactate synthase small subunit [Parasporobacterium sp.]|nr:acetolactate synthase small subunit [Parasporobacterium sp.]